MANIADNTFNIKCTSKKVKRENLFHKSNLRVYFHPFLFLMM